MIECSFFLSVVGLVISVDSNRGAQKVACKGFQYMKDRDTYTDTGVKIDWRCENRKVNNFFFLTNQFSTKFRLNFDEIRRIFDQLS